MSKRLGCQVDIVAAEVGHSVSEAQLRAGLEAAKAEGKVRVSDCQHVSVILWKYAHLL